MGRKAKQPKTDTYAGRVAMRIGELRRATGLTGAEVADKLKLPHSTYYVYENGSREVPLDLFPRLARVLGVTVREILPER